MSIEVSAVAERLPQVAVLTGGVLGVKTLATLLAARAIGKGVGAALVDLIGGRVEAMFSTVPAALGSVRSGKVRALAVTSAQRDADVPDVPTFAESGLPDFEVVSWQGLCTNAGSPQVALDRLRASLAAVLAQPEVRKRISEHGFAPHVLPADQFAVYARAERARWTKLVKDIGIVPK
jgi:tripartite-type tricarboxylate transporter receptor subunit TctC